MLLYHTVNNEWLGVGSRRDAGAQTPAGYRFFGFTIQRLGDGRHDILGNPMNQGNADAIACLSIKMVVGHWGKIKVSRETLYRKTLPWREPTNTAIRRPN